MAKTNLAEKPAVSAAKWGVLDKLQGQVPGKEDEPRIHLIAGIKYSLYSRANRVCKMPEAHARIFLRDPAFRVFNDVGDEIPPISPEAQTRAGEAIPTLQTGQTIATLHELTDEAIRTRVALMPGGDRYFEQSRDVMIEFIAERQNADEMRRENARRAASKPDGDGLEDAGISDIETVFDRGA